MSWDSALSPRLTLASPWALIDDLQPGLRCRLREAVFSRPSLTARSWMKEIPRVGPRKAKRATGLEWGAFYRTRARPLCVGCGRD